VRRGRKLALGAVALSAVVLAGTLVTWRVVRDSATACPSEGMAHEIASLIAPNGLYYLPQLRESRGPSLYDSAYGLMTLRVLGGEPSFDRATVDLESLRAGDRAGSPIWSRWYVLAVERATRQRLLTEDDAKVVAATLRPDGTFDDRAKGAPRPALAQQVATTSAALDVLEAVRGHGYTTTLRSTGSWLVAAMPSFDGNPYVLSLAAQGLHSVGLAVPPEAVAAAETWYRTVRESRTSVDYSAASHGLFGYAKIMELAGREPERDAAFFSPLFRAAAEQNDLQDAYHAAVAWAAMNGAPHAIDGLRERIQRSVLSSGLVEENAVLVGTIGATYTAARLLQATGEPHCLGVSPDVLVSAKDANWTQWDSITKAMWIALAEETEIEVDDPLRREVYRALMKDVPEVSPNTAKRWAVIVELLMVVGGRLPSPSLHSWPVKDRSGVNAAAIMVNSAVTADQPLEPLSWVPAEDLLAALSRPELAPTLTEYLDALRAYVALGGVPTSDILDSARHRLNELRGCPGLPHLMRATPDAAVCDLAATRSATAVTDQIPGLRT
jgi:hypothetical protein